MAEAPSYSLTLSLDALRAPLEATAAEAGVALDFLMRRWTGRVAIWNVGIPTTTIVDPRRNVRGEARHYRLLGRLKASHRDGTLHLSLHPPTACDLAPTAEDQALWDHFAARLGAQLAGQVEAE